MKIEEIEIEENFAELLEESEKNTATNTVVEGTIVEMTDNDLLVDVGQKSEGKLNISEITIDGKIQYKVNDKIKVMITSDKGERPTISYKKVLQKEKFDEFAKKYGEESQDVVVEGTVVSVKPKAGFIVQDADGMEYFMPMAQGYLKAKDAIGKKIKALVLKLKPESSSVVISRRKLIEETQKNKETKISQLMENDEPKTGIVKKITSYGMFVDLGGVDGLVNYNEISYKGPVNPAAYYKEGDEVLTKIKSYDKEKGHLSLSIKDAMTNPWDEMRDTLEVGDIISVTVSNFESYGAFVDLGNDIEGLLHISEISHNKNVKNPKEYLELGHEINVEVIDLDCDKRRLRVSLKSLQPKPFEVFTQEHKVGDVVEGTVATITDFGAFINLGVVDGLLHNEEASWDTNAKCKNIYKKGDKVEAKIIKIDNEKENISLSAKALQESPAQKFEREHKVGDIIKAPVKDIKEFGLFIKLADNLDGLIRKEDLLKPNDSNEEIKVDDEIEAVIVNIDKNRNRVRLSVKRLASQKERDMLKSVNDNTSMTLGDAIKGKLRK
jgi:small subunit ribosomal protein S1